MNKQQGLAIVEGLRNAQAAGAAVVELSEDARNFNWVTVREREVLLGSFCVESGKKFFALVASTPRSIEDFQFMVYEKFKGSPVLTTRSATDDGVVWTYSTSKQHGDNKARKKAFFEAAKSDSITIPFPAKDITAFSAAVTRAIELRRLADAAGATGEVDEEVDDIDDVDDVDGSDESALAILKQLYPDALQLKEAVRFLADSIRFAHSLTPNAWAVHVANMRIRLGVCALRVLELHAGEVTIIVDPEKVDAKLRESLGAQFEPGNPKVKNPYGQVLAHPSSLATLPPEVRIAHEAFITHAATTTLVPHRPAFTPFSAYHEPSILEEIETILGDKLPRPAYSKASQPRYWKASPGQNGEQWDECRAGGFIAIGWDKLGDLTNVSQEEFEKRVEELGASRQVWKFRNIQVGDRIVANNGTTRVLGIGTVTGTYYYADVEGKRKHRLPVRWEDTNERVVSQKGWRMTLIRLNRDTFDALVSAPLVGAKPDDATSVAKEDEVAPEGGIDFDGILSQLASKSLSFSAELVASYLLALQAKRFVLLTGISGTGKTRLAQEIARVFGPAVEQAHAPATDAFEIVAKPSQLKYARFIVPSELAQEFDALTNPEVRRIDLKVPGRPLASMAFHKNPDRGNLFYLLLSGDLKEWFTANIKVGGRFYLSRKTSGEKEWLDLALPSGGQATSGDKTYELIAVRPDWTDARALLGFYNPLTKTYLSTPTLQLLLRARAEVHAANEATPPRPFFLIFDEMNLARVEHYFSDFLSAMESGEAIHLHDDPQVEEEEDVPRRITIPKNVFVIGTVNVDETTYMFSPKVLDRAFVLEFNDVNLKGLGEEIEAEAAESTPLALVNLEGGLKLRGSATDEEWQRFGAVLNGEASALLHTLHATLAIENRHFGYRVAREVARFVDLAVEQAGPNETTARAALDVAVLAKILPKLHGSQAEIGVTLKRLLAIAIADKPEAEVFTKHGAVIDGAAIPLPRTARKLWRMMYRLAANGFVSFIE
jgi:5-methylcytosine-specific restriction enzyme B